MDKAVKKAADRLLIKKYTDILLACTQKVCIEVYKIIIVNWLTKVLTQH